MLLLQTRVFANNPRDNLQVPINPRTGLHRGVGRLTRQPTGHYNDHYYFNVMSSEEPLKVY